MNIDERITELIAIGASVVANCQSCVQYHAAKASELGVGREEIGQAVRIGRMVRAGAAAKTDRIADDLLGREPASAANGDTKTAPASAGGCCGSAPAPPA